MNDYSSAIAAKKLLYYIGEIDDSFIEEAFMSNMSNMSNLLNIASRKRLMRYSTLAAAASVGIAVTFWYIKSKKSA